MLRNYLAAALRNLFRNGAYAIINIFGLALGFAAIILIALYVRDEYSYDRFFPDHDRVYRLMETVSPPGESPLRIAVTASNIAPAMKLDFPEVEAATRLAAKGVVLRQGSIVASAQVYWADPNFFRIFPMKVVAGNLDEALNRPDGLVLTRKTARRYFGRDDVMGKALEMDRKYTMHVAAVIEDLPSNTHLDAEVFAPGIAKFSALSLLDARDADPNALRSESVYTYVRLRPGAKVARVAAGMKDFALRHVSGKIDGVSVAKVYAFSLVPLTDVHLQPNSIADMKPPGDVRTLQTMIGIAGLILFVAGSNFVSMMTARAAGRAVEVGVRKAEGASRGQIIAQFLGECLFYTALALMFAIFAVQLVLPALNGFLQRDIAFDYLRDPVLAAAILTVWLVTGLAAGAYAAFVLSMFRPGTVLKGVVFLPGGSGRLRQALVIFQFGTLIALIVSTITIQHQTQYAMQERLRLPTEQIYLAQSGCPASFRDEVARIRGVIAASCASGAALSYDRSTLLFDTPNGGKISLKSAPVDYGFFELFGIKPIAGRLFSQDRGEDDLLRANPHGELNPSIVLNESGLRALGYASAQSAINEYRRWNRLMLKDGSSAQVTDSQSSQIIGVVPDFSVGSVRDVTEPTGYYIDPSRYWISVLKLDGHAMPETMRAVKALWEQTQDSPLDGLFLSQRVNELYADIQRQAAIFSVFAAVAIVIASLGLLGLAVFTAERRTREIGLRKVMGASRWDILRLLGWQFAQPVLWANVIAWPSAYLLMRHWLEGFAYHVDLNPLAFLAASALALLIALATVSGHALLVARTRPVVALRYE
ncbi:MAG: ABC transporter permease [Steroidobacteraceae bacterium]